MAEDGLCTYKDIFGKPNEGAHAIRIPLVNIALVDTVTTIILAYVLYILLDGRYYFISILVFLILMGIIFHFTFCVNTRLNSILF